MEELKFSLMHKNDPVCAVTIDGDSGAMLRVSKPVNADLLPLGGNIDAAMLRGWWNRRAVPVGQGKIMQILEKAGIFSPQRLLVRNLGLSLADHYWIKPFDVDFDWKDVNLFTNPFRDCVGELQFAEAIGEVIELPENAFSPSSSVQGELRKKWTIADGSRFLIKANHGGNSQESLNEVAAALLHSKQNRQPYVRYDAMQMERDDQFYCICKCFTSDSIELITAYDMIQSEKKRNSVSYYQHLIQVCTKHGMDEDVIRSFLEYQIVTDFVLTNTDRHLRNIGVLRDTNTLKLVGMAPIFDTGNAMFWKNPRLPLHDSLMDIEVNSFRTKEMQLLAYVERSDLIDSSELPTTDELRRIYEVDPLITCLDSILLGYQKKIDILVSKGKL